MDDLFIVHINKEISHVKIGRPTESITQEQSENFPKEMSTF